MSILLTSTSRRGRNWSFRLALAIGLQRELIVDAGCQVAEMRRWNIFLHHRLELEHVERLPGIGNQVLKIARGPLDRIGSTQSLGESALREQGTRREELKEAAAAEAVDMT
jgi:hypothetical protein